MAISAVKRKMLQDQGTQLSAGQLLMLNKGPLFVKQKASTNSVKMARFAISGGGPLYDPIQSRLNREAGYWS